MAGKPAAGFEASSMIWLVLYLCVLVYVVAWLIDQEPPKGPPDDEPREP